jgi:hypothetical protein
LGGESDRLIGGFSVGTFHMLVQIIAAYLVSGEGKLWSKGPLAVCMPDLTQVVE